MPTYSLDTWSSEFPTEENIGQWLYVKHHDTEEGFPPAVRLREVRKGSKGELYLAPESSTGMQRFGGGMELSLYSRRFTQFSGPVPLPPGFDEIRELNKKRYGQ